MSSQLTSAKPSDVGPLRLIPALDIHFYPASGTMATAEPTLEVAWTAVTTAMNRCGPIGVAIIEKDTQWLQQRDANLGTYRLKLNESSPWYRLRRLMAIVANPNGALGTEKFLRQRRAFAVRDALIRASPAPR